MHEISGDTPLSARQKLQYFSFNLSRGIAGLFTSFPQRQFVPQKLRDGSESLMRKYIDAFCTEEIPRQLAPRKISILDIGCGTGYLRHILAEQGYSGIYHGIDVVREPKFGSYDTSAFASTLELAPIEDAHLTQIYDLVISNTSFEHIKDDRCAALQARRACKDGGIEVHIVPSFWGLFVYVWHGYRQYTPKRIEEVFGDSPYVAYRLGGLPSFLCQFFLGTVPERLTGRMIIRKQRWYNAIARVCARCDRYLPVCPIGYAILIRHA